MSRYMDFRAGAMEPFGGPSRAIEPLRFGASDSSQNSSAIKNELLSSLYAAVSGASPSTPANMLSAVRRALQDPSKTKAIILALNQFFNKIYPRPPSGGGKKPNPLDKINDSMSRFSAAGLDELNHAQNSVAGLAGELELISSALSNLIIPACASASDAGSKECLAFAREIADHIRSISQRLAALLKGNFGKNHQAIANALLNQDAAKARALLRSSEPNDAARQQLLERILARLSPILTASALSDTTLKSLESQVNEILRSPSNKGKNISQIIDEMVRANLESGSLSEQNRAQLNHLLAKLVEALNMRNPYSFVGGARRGVSVPNRMEKRVEEDNRVQQTLRSPAAADLVYISFNREYAKLVDQVMTFGRNLCSSIDHGSQSISPSNHSFRNLVEVLNRLATFDQKAVVVAFSTLASDEKSRKLRANYIASLNSLSTILGDFGRDSSFKTADGVRHVKALLDTLKRWDNSAEKSLRGRTLVYNSFTGGANARISKLVSFGDWSNQLQSAVDRSQVANIQTVNARSSPLTEKHQNGLSSKFIQGYEQRIKNALVIFHSLKNNVVRSSESIMQKATKYPSTHDALVRELDNLRRLGMYLRIGDQIEIDAFNSTFNGRATDKEFRPTTVLKWINEQRSTRAIGSAVVEEPPIFNSFSSLLDKTYLDAAKLFYDSKTIEALATLRRGWDQMYQKLIKSLIQAAAQAYDNDIVDKIRTEINFFSAYLFTNCQFEQSLSLDKKAVAALGVTFIRPTYYLGLMGQRLQQIVMRLMYLTYPASNKVGEKTYSEGEAFISRYSHYFDVVGEIIARQYNSVIELMHLLTSINRYVSRTISNLSIGKVGIKNVSDVINSLKTSFDDKLFSETRSNMEILNRSAEQVKSASEANLMNMYEAMRTNAFNLSKKMLPLRLLLRTVTIINGENLHMDMLTEGRILDEICNYVSHTYLTLCTENTVINYQAAQMNTNESPEKGLYYGVTKPTLKDLANFVSRQNVPNNKKNIMYAATCYLASVSSADSDNSIYPLSTLGTLRDVLVPVKSDSNPVVHKIANFVSLFYPSKNAQVKAFDMVKAYLDQHSFRNVRDFVSLIYLFISNATDELVDDIDNSLAGIQINNDNPIDLTTAPHFEPDVIVDSSYLTINVHDDNSISGRLFDKTFSFKAIPKITRIDKTIVTFQNAASRGDSIEAAFQRLFKREDFDSYVLACHALFCNVLSASKIEVSTFFSNYFHILNSLLYSAIGGADFDDFIDPVPLESPIQNSKMKFPFGFYNRKFLFAAGPKQDYVWSDTNAVIPDSLTIEDTTLDRPFMF